MRLKIDDDQLIGDFFHNCRLLGIVAPQKDYMFIWNINQILGFKFRSSLNVEIQLKKKQRDYYFNIYEYDVPGTGTQHLLYENQHDGEYLLPEFKHLDFFWLIKECTLTEEEFAELQESVKKIPAVQMVTEVNHEIIRNKKNLIY